MKRKRKKKREGKQEETKLSLSQVCSSLSLSPLTFFLFFFVGTYSLMKFSCISNVVSGIIPFKNKRLLWGSHGYMPIMGRRNGWANWKSSQWNHPSPIFDTAPPNLIIILDLETSFSVISRNPKSPVVAICTTETFCNNTAQHLSIYLGLHPLKFVLIIDFSDQDRLPSGQFLVLAEDFWNILLHNLEIIETLNAYTIYTLMGLPMLSVPSVSATWCGPPGATAVRGNWKF